jgi:phosphate transport system substrate-binding protein
MKLLSSLCIAALGAAMMFAPQSALAGKKISIVGSTTVLPMAQACSEQFMNNNPDIDITISGGGSGHGIAAMIDGATDIANASRAMKKKEIKKARSKGIKPKANVVAKDGIAVIVNPENKINSLSKEQVKKIYTGEINYWEEIGGTPGRIIVVSRDSSSGTFEVFGELALDEERVRPDALMAASNQAVHNNVSKIPGAIGYVGMGYLSPAIKPIAFNGVKPTEANVVSGDYILARPLFMYTNGEPTGVIKEYLDFVLSKRGQKLAAEQGYIGLK